VYCSRCGGVTEAQSMFCSRCGARLPVPATTQPGVGPAAWSPAQTQSIPAPYVPGRRSRAALLSVVAPVVLVITVAAIGILLLNRGSGPNPGVAAPVPPLASHAAATAPAAPSASTASSLKAVSPVVKTVTVPPPSSHQTAGVAVKTVTIPPSSHQAVTAVTKTVIPTPTATPTAMMDIAAIYKKQQSGVIRIETISCSNSGVGTGFLLSPTLVATVDHVVAQSAVVSLINGSQRTTGTVIGADPAHDLALVRADQPLTGYQFHFSTVAASVGDPVAAIGFPIGGPITLTHGDISGLNREIAIEGTTRTGLLQTDTPLNPGNSGGPLIASDGSVVGLVDALLTNANGIAYAVPADQASAADRQWAAAPAPQPPANCQNPLGPSQQQANIPAPPPGSLSGAQINGIVDAFNRYFNGINAGDYAAAYSVLAPSRQSPADYEGFANGVSTTYDSAITILGSRLVDANTVSVDLAFNSLQTSQNGPDGDTCDNWTLVFSMVQQSDGTWRMDGAKPYNGSTHTSC